MRSGRQRPRGPSRAWARRRAFAGRSRVPIRPAKRVVRYRAPAWTVVLPVVTVALLVTAAALTGLLLVGAVAVPAVILGWLALTLRVTRPEPTGGRGDGPAPPGAGVREPRRPLPLAPAGAAALPMPQPAALPTSE